MSSAVSTEQAAGIEAAAPDPAGAGEAVDPQAASMTQAMRADARREAVM